MDAAEFRAAWEGPEDQLCQYPPDSISASSLPEGAKHFLLAAGLPREAAPCLNFGPMTLDWLRARDDGLERLYPLGSDGSGDPLAMDEHGVVWLIDHQSPCRKTFVNSSVEALAECLLAYRKLVLGANAIGGDDAFIDGTVPMQIIEACSRFISKLDNEAVSLDFYWGQQLSNLMAEAKG